MGRRFAGIPRSRASIKQIDLPPAGAFSTRFVAAELKDTNRPSALMEGAWLSSFAGVPSAAAREELYAVGSLPQHPRRYPQKDLGAIVLHRCVGNKTPVETQCRRFFGNGSR